MKVGDVVIYAYQEDGKDIFGLITGKVKDQGTQDYFNVSWGDGKKTTEPRENLFYPEALGITEY